MTMNLKFEGVFPANPTPYKDGKILEEALRGIFEDNISHGVNGFWVAGSTGEDRGGFKLEGENLIDGFRKLGYLTLGSGAVAWFDSNSPTG